MKCLRCSEWIANPSDNECYWDYQGIIPVKVTVCKKCGAINPVIYEQINNPNDDARFYYYPNNRSKLTVHKEQKAKRKK